MNIKIYPGSCHGTIIVPPSKSILHRAIICASLAKEESIITPAYENKDVLTTIEALKALGSHIKNKNLSYIINGRDTLKKIKCRTLLCNESGSSLRFLIPLCTLQEQQITLYGSKRLMERPIQEYTKIFLENDVYFKKEEDCYTIQGKLKQTKFRLNGNVSSQFISGLLFTLPLLPYDSEIEILTDVESRSYIELTIDVLSKFQIQCEFNESILNIKGNQSYQSQTFHVEGDYSSFSFFAVLAALNHTLSFRNINIHSLQSDRKILEILQSHIVELQNEQSICIIKNKPFHNSFIDIKDCPDLGPILCVLGAFSQGKLQLHNTKRLRLKESDRIYAMETELKKLGVKISSDDNNIYIIGKDTYHGNVTFSSHNDHRIAMSLAIASTLCKNPCIIKNAEVVEKSYPNFFKDLASVHIKIESC